VAVVFYLRINVKTLENTYNKKTYFKTKGFLKSLFEILNKIIWKIKRFFYKISVDILVILLAQISL